jgi:hypothetical protein
MERDTKTTRPTGPLPDHGTAPKAGGQGRTTKRMPESRLGAAETAAARTESGHE